MERQSPECGRTETGPAVPWPERITAALGLLLVLGALGILIYRGVMREGKPPRIEVHVIGVQPQPSGGYLVRIAAFNAGDQTAAQVEIAGELKRDGALIETSRVTFDYLPDRSRRQGGLFFTRDPRQHALDVRAKGYIQP